MAVELWHDGPWITVTFSGTITGADIETLFTQVFELEGRLPMTPDRLVDLGASSTVAIGFADIASAANRRLDVAPANPIRTALVAHTPAQRGYARMFQTLNDHPAVTIEVFEDRASAEAWLKGV